jgi:hypothetical protein
MKKWVVIGLFAFVVGFAIGIFLFGGGITGRAVEDIEKNYSYTTAVCNDYNQCIDVLIECEQGKVKKIVPVSELVEFEDDWEDVRGDGEFCE